MRGICLGMGALLATSLLACGGSKKCLLDTDCDLGERCSLERCVPVQRDTGTPEQDSSTPPTDSGTSPMDGGDSTDTGTTEDAGDGLIRTGTLVASSSTLDGNSFRSVSATFAATEPSSCSDMTRDSCTLTACPAPPPPTDGGMAVDAGTPPAAPHAGVIVFNAGGEVVTLVPDDATGLYPVSSSDVALWDSELELTADGLGDTIPAFGLGTQTPIHVEITSPAPESLPIAIPRSEAFTMSWANVSQGALVARLVAVGGDGASYTFTCVFDPGALAGAIPVELLQMLPPGLSGTLSVSAVTSDQATAGAYTVNLYAVTPAYGFVGGVSSAVSGLPVTLD